jgi:Mg2+-importing ATPase
MAAFLAHAGGRGNACPCRQEELMSASRRLARDGANVIEAGISQTLVVKLGRRLAEPLTAILPISAGISGATGDWQSFVIIVLIVVLSIILDVFHEYKTESAIGALKRSVAVTARVRRDGRARALLVKDIVRGDVVELKAGDLTVPQEREQINKIT